MFRKSLITALVVIFSAILVDYVFAESVCKVYDGDTFTLCSGQRIRMAGIDAPELKQPYGKASRDYLKSLVDGRDVKLKCKGKTYDRITCQASILVSGKVMDLGTEMVGRGFAFDSPHYSKGAFIPAENFAKSQGRGVWQLPDGGERPWAYRKRTKHKS